jgi:hypothetical protein
MGQGEGHNSIMPGGEQTGSSAWLQRAKGLEKLDGPGAKAGALCALIQEPEGSCSLRFWTW